MGTAPVILWDFDGTLGQRRSGMWGGGLLELLDRELPEHGVTPEGLSPHLQDGFPWHNHHLQHQHLNEPEAWWEHITDVLATALHRAGLRHEQARRVVAAGFRDVYLHEDAWELYPDARPALAAAAAAGWRNVILSNHVPELPELIARLGVAELIEAVITSARVGAEKPHPVIFRAALDAAGHPAEVWMVGDNPIADIAGAARLGIPGVLVRARSFDPAYIERMNTHYAGTEWLDWRDHIQHRTDGLIDAIQLITRDTVLLR